MPRRCKGADAGLPPTRADLHEAAVAYLARYSATQAGLLAFLFRRVERWGRVFGQLGGDPDTVQAATAMAVAAAREVAEALMQAGAIDDARFAEARARRLLRGGRSNRAIRAHLLGKGVAAPLALQAMPEPDSELAAALAYARRRRIGPYGAAAGTADARRAELAMLARAGFPADVAGKALATERDAADLILHQLRQG